MTYCLRTRFVSQVSSTAALVRKIPDGNSRCNYDALLLYFCCAAVAQDVQNVHDIRGSLCAATPFPPRTGRETSCSYSQRPQSFSGVLILYSRAGARSHLGDDVQLVSADHDTGQPFIILSRTIVRGGASRRRAHPRHKNEHPFS